MRMRPGSVHEPEAELLSADDAIEDAEQLRVLLRREGQAEPAVAVRVPLWALLEAVDHLEATALQQIAQHAEERLAIIRNAA